MIRRFTTLALVVVSVAASAACEPGLGDYSGPRYTHYVAIGDSYAAAPYVPTTAIARGCMRSNHNYPSLTAAVLKVKKFTDVTCTGANTDQVWKTTKTTFLNMKVAKQIDAVTADTDLITMTIGFNNHHLFANVASLCGRKPSLCNLSSRRATFARWVADLRPSLIDTVAAVKKKAPRARILLVSYPKIAPETGGCKGLPRLGPRDLATLNWVNKAVVAAQKQAAKAEKVEFADFYNHSIGHDICSYVPWIQGIPTNKYRADAMHPLPLGEREAAAFVLRSLELPIPPGYAGAATPLKGPTLSPTASPSPTPSISTSKTTTGKTTTGDTTTGNITTGQESPR